MRGGEADQRQVQEGLRDLPEAILTLQGGAPKTHNEVHKELGQVVHVMKVSRGMDQEKVQTRFGRLDIAYHF